MDKKYIAALHSALHMFQMLEEALKIIVGLSYEVIAAVSPAPIRFNFDRNSIIDAPLGKLISMYAKVTDNKEMTNHLRNITKWRNFCAHNAFRHESYIRMGKSEYTTHSHADLIQVAKHGSELLLSLGTEIVTLQHVHKRIVASRDDAANT